MTQEIHPSKVNTWFMFIGTFLLLIGIYASVRTIINVAIFPQYPQSGVLFFNTSGVVPYYQRNSDCIQTQPYYGQDGSARESSAEEKTQQATTEKNCLQGVTDAREQAKMNDVGTSAFFLFLGIGVLFSRRFFN